MYFVLLLFSLPPILSPPFQLQVDASATGAGAVLLQEDQAGNKHPVSFFSKKFSKSQQNYSTIEKEALALLLALQHFEVYLGGTNLGPSTITVYTDHNPLVFIMRMSNANQRLMRWSLIIQEYNIKIRCPDILSYPSDFPTSAYCAHQYCIIFLTLNNNI